jgi:peptide/nickel transport system substrate-binding protein
MPENLGDASMARLTVRLCCAAIAAASFAGAAQAQTTLTWGKPSEITALDPQVSGDATAWAFFYVVYERLVTTGDDMRPAPQLAQSWEQASPTSYIFKLRPGAAFSNGRALTAEDVAASFKRLKDPKRGAAWGRQLGALTDIVAVDPTTVRFELSQPLTPILAILAVAPLSIVPVKEIDEGSFDPTKELLGSGPYKVVEHKQDESWTLERNPHWRKEKQILDRLVIRIMGDDATRVAALREGRVDLATFENPNTPSLLKAIPNVETFIQKTNNYFRLDISGVQENSPLRDDRLRQAVNLAIDRQKMVDIVFGGESNVEYPIPAAFEKSACRDHPVYAQARPERLKRARELVKAAGAENATLGIIASPVLVTYPLIAQMMQRDLKEIGLNAEVQQVPVAEWYKRVFQPQTDFHMAVSWFAGYTDPSIIMNWWVPNFARFNVGFLKPIEAFPPIMDRIRAEPEGPQRDALMAEGCKLIMEDSNMLALVNKPDYIGYRKDRLEPRFAKLETAFDMFKHIEEFKLKR